LRGDYARNEPERNVDGQPASQDLRPDRPQTPDAASASILPAHVPCPGAGDRASAGPRERS